MKKKSFFKNIFYFPFITCGFLICVSFGIQAQSLEQWDYLIKNATVFDGTGHAGVKADVGIEGDRIVFVGKADTVLTAKNTIDGEGLFLTPGFIDPHTHYGKWVNSKSSEERAVLPCLNQGVTTIFLGSDGGGTYAVQNEIKKYTSSKIGVNVAFFVGLGSVRGKVLGLEDVAPDSVQLGEMEKLVAQGMKEGAFGLSTGLYYAPQSYSTTSEVIAMAKMAKEFGGVYDTHMRSESNELEKAVVETIDIGKATGIPLMISHIKCLGPAAWGTSSTIISLINGARNQGVNMIASQYPYTASHTSLKAMLIPGWAQSGGDKAMVARLTNPDTLIVLMEGLSQNLSIRGGDTRIVISSKDARYNNKSLHEIAMELKMSPEDAAVKILTEIPDVGGNSFSMVESDVINFMKQKWVVTGSDAVSDHPRGYSTFVRKIKEYSIDKKVLTMPEVIHLSTGLTATFLGIKNRGFVKEGYYADLVLFDPNQLRDNATYSDPKKKPSGIQYVFVNGKLAIKNGNYTGELAGQPLLHHQ